MDLKHKPAGPTAAVRADDTVFQVSLVGVWFHGCACQRELLRFELMACCGSRTSPTPLELYAQSLPHEAEAAGHQYQKK